jgi:hypothetical protein
VILLVSSPKHFFSQRRNYAQVLWFTLVIPGTQEAEIGRISVHGLLMQKVCETPSQPISAGQGGACPSSQLQWKAKGEDHKRITV